MIDRAGNRRCRVQVIGTGDLRGHLAVRGRPITYGYLSEFGDAGLLLAR